MIWDASCTIPAVYQKEPEKNLLRNHAQFYKDFENLFFFDAPLAECRGRDTRIQDGK